jgi:acetyl esterase/lipase
MEIFNLWENVPGMCEFTPTLEYYPAKYYSGVSKKAETTVVIFPGGGYGMRAEHEGKGYADYFNAIGMDAFVCQYRVSPHRYPLPLLDARRAIQFVRYNAEKFGINPEKVGVMGSSAGGHLAAMVSDVYDNFDDVIENKDEIDKIDFIPDFQILCYPVIAIKDFGHIGSGKNLLGDEYADDEKVTYLSIQNRVNEKTPKAFIWHTAEDQAVPVENSLLLAKALSEKGVPFELHCYQNGPHGLGLLKAPQGTKEWGNALLTWLEINNLK